MVTQEEVNKYIDDLMKDGLSDVYAIRDKVASKFNVTDVEEVHELIKQWSLANL